MLYLPPQSDGRLGPLGLGVVHVTLHMALREVFEHITVENIQEKIGLAHHVFDRIGKATGNPYKVRIAVAALNPHCGEQGRFGREEIEIIQPRWNRPNKMACPSWGHSQWTRSCTKQPPANTTL